MAKSTAKNNARLAVQIAHAANEVGRSPQKVCCTYCSLEPGMTYHKEITVLEGVQNRPFRTVPTGWGEC